jgi:hypothetical protein
MSCWPLAKHVVLLFVVLQGHALGFAILASISSGTIPGVSGQ